MHKDRERDPEDNNAEFIYVHATSTKPRQVLHKVSQLYIQDEKFFNILLLIEPIDQQNKGKLYHRSWVVHFKH